LIALHAIITVPVEVDRLILDFIFFQRIVFTFPKLRARHVTGQTSMVKFKTAFAFVLNSKKRPY
jgi:hypothetical protein